MSARTEHLHIRASGDLKSLLTRAAATKSMTLSQFVLSTAVPEAQRVLNDDAAVIQSVFRLNEKDWNDFMEALDAPVRDIPALRNLLQSGT